MKLGDYVLNCKLRPCNVNLNVYKPRDHGARAVYMCMPICIYISRNTEVRICIYVYMCLKSQQVNRKGCSGAGLRCTDLPGPERSLAVPP